MDARGQDATDARRILRLSCCSFEDPFHSRTGEESNLAHPVGPSAVLRVDSDGLGQRDLLSEAWGQCDPPTPFVAVVAGVAAVAVVTGSAGAAGATMVPLISSF